MEVLPIKTRLMQPPKDDLFALLDEYLTDVRDGDVLTVASKVVAIHQGRCIKNDGTIDKEELARQEADYYLPKGESGTWNIAVKYHALLMTAGIDESNSDGYFSLLPEKPNEAAREIWEYVRKKFDIENLGVIITDAHSIPFRFGVMGVSIGFWGFEPVKYFIGKKDLFGRPFKYTRVGVVDSLAATGAYAMGETTEQSPLCIIRNAPHLEFTDKDMSDELLIPPEEDIYYTLFKPLYKEGDKKDKGDTV